MEGQTFIQSVRGYPYRTKQGISDELGIGKSTVFNRAKEIKEEIKNGRYSDYAIIEDGGIVLINLLVFIDYLKYHKMLKNKNLRKITPPFRPEEMIKMMGWNNRIVKLDEGGEEL